jgi:hypothetical protein
MAGLVRWIPLRQIGPLGSGSQHPQDPVQYFPAAAPGPSPTVGPLRQLADERFEDGPLFVRQIHGRCILLIGYSLSPIYEISSRH